MTVNTAPRRKGCRRKLTEGQIAALLEDYGSARNESVAAIASRHGVSKQTLYNYISAKAAEQQEEK
jgi:AcrR family transcriptional regulator